MKKKAKEKSVQQRAEEYLAGDAEALKKHKLAKKTVIMFPNQKPPLLGKLAGWVIRKYGGRIETLFIELK